MGKSWQKRWDIGKMLLKSLLPKLEASKFKHIRSCLKQLQADSKQVFGEKEYESWKINSTNNFIPCIFEHQPQLKGVHKGEIAWECSFSSILCRWKLDEKALTNLSVDRSANASTSLSSRWMLYELSGRGRFQNYRKTFHTDFPYEEQDDEKKGYVGKNFSLKWQFIG